jgi:3-hydroxyisobutyrate dehydrogenase
MQMERIGFIGLGVMGVPMAQHVAAAGYPLTVYDIDQGAFARLQARRPEVGLAKSPRAVAEVSDIVMTMLPSGLEVRDAVLGPDGLQQGFKPGGLLLDTSSSEPWYTKEIAASLTAVGVSMVDAPVSGAEAGAINAELVFMAGGDEASINRARPLFDILGKKVFHLGPTGAGHTMKSINNLITAASLLATTEGLIMGTGSGLDPAVMIEVLNDSTGMSWISRTQFAQRILNRRFDDPFKLDLMVKDINIALQVAHDLNLHLSHSEATQALWRAIQATLPKGCSLSELVRALESSTGVPLISRGGKIVDVQ